VDRRDAQVLGASRPRVIAGRNAHERGLSFHHLQAVVNFQSITQVDRAWQVERLNERDQLVYYQLVGQTPLPPLDEEPDFHGDPQAVPALLAVLEHEVTFRLAVVGRRSLDRWA
jgi:hypothetical protein